MIGASRFCSPAGHLSLHSLAHKAAHASLLSLCVALLLHAALTRLGALRTQAAPAKPLTTQFVKRAPRLSKPLELKKRPRPRRRRMERETVSVRPRASAPDASASVRSPDLLPILARPDVRVSRMGYTAGLDLEPQVAAQHVTSAREDEHQMDMSLEMLDVEALDYGKYSALVIQDPNDKRNIKGFVRLAHVLLSDWLSPAPYPSLSPQAAVRLRRAELDHLAQHFRDTVGYLDHATGIKVKVHGTFSAESPEVLRIAWVPLEMPFKPVFSEQETANLGRSMLGGAFLMMNGLSSRSNEYQSEAERAQLLVKAALASQGYQIRRQWVFERLGKDHELCHCFFDFPEGPPHGDWDEILDIVRIQGRTLCLVAPGWVFDSACSTCQGWEQLRHFVANTLVFALTQEGSLAHRITDTYTGM